MGTIIFHPGMGKTATTAIQQLGKDLPMDNPESVCFSPFGYIKETHNVFAQNHPQFDPLLFNVELQKLIDFASKRIAATVVSSEFLLFSPFTHISHMINQIKSKGLGVEVIVSVRNYSDYLISAYLQAVKVQWGMKDNESITDYAHRELSSTKILTLVDRWARAVGDEHVYILDYDKFKHNFVAKFFNYINVTSGDYNSFQHRVNDSIPLASFKILLEFDKVCKDPEKRLNLQHFLSTCMFDSKFTDELRAEVGGIVKNSYQHDLKRLTQRYTLID